jgi:hypothetical protein
MSDVEDKGFWVEGVWPKRRVRMTKLYNVWSSMKSRCSNAKHHAFARYGARGIAVCAEWQAFGTFRAWAIKSGYVAGRYIDRINNDEGYSPSNCRWVSAAGSVRNRRATRLNPDLAAAIRAAAGTSTEVAAELGLCREHVRDIRKGKIWRHP